MRLPWIGWLGCFSLWAADLAPADLIALAHRSDGAELAKAIRTALRPDDLRKGLAFAAHGSDALFAVENASPPVLYVDDSLAGPMHRIANSDLWFSLVVLAQGRSHKFYYIVNGQRWGGISALHQRGPGPDVPAYQDECYPMAGVPQGSLSKEFTQVSRIYPGMTTHYWVYAPAQYNRDVSAPVMIWQDGGLHIHRDGPQKTLNVVDNLTYEKKLPVMIQLLIDPGKIGERRMRSAEYDVMDDTYARFLHDEILPEVATNYNIRSDAYSIGLWGYSSSGDGAFNAAWTHAEWFSRVMTSIASFTSIQWRKGTSDGANILPFEVRKEPKRNIRVWLQDGSDDSENEHGSWPLMNMQMANSLKWMEYDFHFAFGDGTHNLAHGDAQMPEALAWLWRGYDPSKVVDIYQMDPEEKTKPPFRVHIYNRK